MNMSITKPTNLNTHPIHLGLGAKAIIQPAFTGGMDWYNAYGERNADDGAEGRLVNLFTFTESWTGWEMHPHGDEVVLCIRGAITLIQETADGSTSHITLGPGEYAINPPGVWHTADVSGEATVLFITAGIGTAHKPR
ncbi:MAG: cupin domain-containing protein [Rhodospirillaceae bacterium]